MFNDNSTVNMMENETNALIEKSATDFTEILKSQNIDVAPALISMFLENVVKNAQGITSKSFVSAMLQGVEKRDANMNAGLNKAPGSYL